MGVDKKIVDINKRLKKLQEYNFRHNSLGLREKIRALLIEKQKLKQIEEFNERRDEEPTE